MNQLRPFLSRVSTQYRGAVFIGGLLLVAGILGLCLAGLVFERTFSAADYSERPICFENSCVSDFLKNFDQVFTILKATLDFLVAIATAGGIVVALLSYLSSVRVSALTNHISHLTLFQQYIASEMQKRDKLSPKCIDVLLLYNKIFFLSREGSTDVSPAYLKFLDGLNAHIQLSNDQAQHGAAGAFRYKPHQVRIRDYVTEVGFSIYLAPRNDFFEMEGQLFMFIDNLNQSLCYSSLVPKLFERKYI